MRAHQLLFQDPTFALCCLFQVCTDSIHRLLLLSAHYSSLPTTRFASKSSPCHTSAASPLTPLFATHPKTRPHKSFSCHTYNSPLGVSPQPAFASCAARSCNLRFSKFRSSRGAVPLRRTLCSAKMERVAQDLETTPPFPVSNKGERTPGSAKRSMRILHPECVFGTPEPDRKSCLGTSFKECRAQRAVPVRTMGIVG